MQKGVPQTMDVTSIKSILHYLSNKILPSKFETAQQPEQNTIQIAFRGIYNTTWIEVSWQADYSRIIQIKKPEKIGSTSTLAKQLSYGLKYMALVAIKQEKFERVIKFEFAKKPGDEVSKYLIFELMGKHSNIFYLDKNLKIITAGRQIKSNQSSYRTISTGILYTPPPINLKKEPNENESFESWRENLLILPDSLKKSLIYNYQGVSPCLLNQISYIVNYEMKENIMVDNIMDQNIESIDERNLRKIYTIWKRWIIRFNNNEFNFTTYNNDFYSVWFSLKETNLQNKVDLVKGLDDYYDYHLKSKKINVLNLKINGMIFKQITIEKKNLNLQETLLKNSENHEDLKSKADNIFLTINLKKKDVILAEKLYKKSKKLKRARDLIKSRVQIYKNKLLRLDEFGVMLENLNLLNIESLKKKIDLLEELKEELKNEFNIYIRKNKDHRKNEKNIASSPIKINSPSGILIQIGRNMRQNDLISFKLSNKQDLWFHAQETPGSHVVLKASVESPTDDDIQITADIASFFCKANGNVKVPINIVRVKDLQRISKAGLGCVSFKKSKIIWGNPNRGKIYIKNNSQS